MTYPTTINFDEFLWANFYFWIISEGDIYYQNLASNSSFLNDLRTNPGQLTGSQVSLNLITNFLKQYKVQGIRSNSQTGQNIINAIQQILQDLNNLQNVNIRNLSTSNSQSIQNVYDSLINVRGVGVTAVTKIMAILNPALFIMWDEPIRTQLQYSKNAKGYVDFLIGIRNVINSIDSTFNNKKNLLNPVPSQNQNIEDYLSQQLGYNPSKTLAKFIDEYNWIKYTIGLTLPPNWHP